MPKQTPINAIFLAALILAGCQPFGAPVPASPTPQAARETQTSTPPADPSPSAAPSPTWQPSLTPIPAPRLCSPLQSIERSQLPTLVSNPYHPPKPGSDDPHTGIDLAMLLPGSQAAVEGNPVAAAIQGKVVMVTRDRFPFGNAVIVETPLESATEAWWDAADIPAPANGPAPLTALTCPASQGPSFPDPNQRSLYILYAHLQEPVGLKVDEAVSCGQVIGSVGKSGNALNPHLHFEVRAGPSGLRLNSMAHYTVDASQEEMSSYCLWTVSGQFQLVDPLKVLALPPD